MPTPPISITTSSSLVSSFPLLEIKSLSSSLSHYYIFTSILINFYNTISIVFLNLIMSSFCGNSLLKYNMQMTSPQLRNLSWVDLVLGPIISHSYSIPGILLVKRIEALAML